MSEDNNESRLSFGVEKAMLIARLPEHKFMETRINTIHSSDQTTPTSNNDLTSIDINLFTTGDLSDPELFAMGENPQTITSKIPNAINIALGPTHAVALNSNGEIFTWGKGMNGKLGHGDDEDKVNPKQIPGSKLFRKVCLIAVGDFHSVAVNEAGTVLTWGMGFFGQLGHGDRRDRFTPSEVTGFSETVVFVACSSTATILVTKSNHLYICGSLDAFHTNESFYKPTKLMIPSDSKISHLSCGDFHAAFVNANGSLFTFGDGTMGQLGIPDVTFLTQPRQVEGAIKNLKINQVACGAVHTVVLTSTNQVFVFGSTYCNGDLAQHNLPKLVEISYLEADPPVSLKSSGMMTTIVTESGKVIYWGAIKPAKQESIVEDEQPRQLQKVSNKNVFRIVSGGTNIAIFTTPTNPKNK